MRIDQTDELLRAQLLSEGGMVIENVDEVSMEGFERDQEGNNVNGFMQRSLKKIVSSVIGKKKDPKTK